MDAQDRQDLNDPFLSIVILIVIVIVIPHPNSYFAPLGASPPSF